MAIDLKAIKASIQARQSEMDRKTGQREALIDSVKKDYGVASLSEGRQLLEREQKELQELLAEEEAAIASFSERFPELVT